MEIYLSCFDIEDDTARQKIGKILLEYGDRVQYSVFEIVVDNTKELDAIKTKCKKYLTETDNLRFYYLPLNARKKSKDVWDESIADYPQAIIL